jgi:hypothetical protein
VNDAAQDAPVVNAARTRLVLGEMRFDRSPLRVAQPKSFSHDPSSVVSELESLFAEKIKDLIGFGT